MAWPIPPWQREPRINQPLVDGGRAAHWRVSLSLLGNGLPGSMYSTGQLLLECVINFWLHEGTGMPALLRGPCHPPTDV